MANHTDEPDALMIDREGKTLRQQEHIYAQGDLWVPKATFDVAVEAILKALPIVECEETRIVFSQKCLADPDLVREEQRQKWLRGQKRQCFRALKAMRAVLWEAGRMPGDG